MNLNTPLYSSGGSPMAFSVFHDAFAIYGTIDYLGSGASVIRMFNYSASPQERDFTATELTDGTYSTWAGSNSAYTRVAIIYNQQGDSDLDLTHPSMSNRHYYDSSTNEIRIDQANQYIYTSMFTTATGASTKVQNAFEDNDATSDTTFVLGARKKNQHLYGLPASGRTMFAIRDMYTPNTAYNAKHKAIAIKSALYSDDIAISARGNDNTHVIEEHDVFDHSTLKTYIGEIERIPASGVTATDMNLFINNTQEVDTQTTSLDSEIDLGRIELGDNRYMMKGALLFNKILTADEKTALHTRMSQDY